MIEGKINLEKKIKQKKNKKNKKIIGYIPRIIIDINAFDK